MTRPTQLQGPLCESLYEDEEFDQRQLAALVVFKVFYYLGELNDSLSYALGAGPLFDVSEDSDYAHALLAKALDEYASFKTRASKATEEEENVDPRLETIVERMLEKCILDGKYQQAMGMAVECRRLDKLEEAIVQCDNIHGALTYCINLSHQYVSHREYRCETLQHPDYLSICQCLMFLGEPETVANILDTLLSGSKEVNTEDHGQHKSNEHKEELLIVTRGICHLEVESGSGPREPS